MAGVSGWYATAYNCPEDPSKSHGIGWYLNGQLLASTYLNPSTGKPYTMAELQGGGGTTPAPATGTAPATNIPNYQEWLTENYPGATTTPEQLTGAHQEYTDWVNSQGYNIGANAQATPTPAAGGIVPAPAALPAIGDVSVPAPAVTPAPAFEISPNQQAWQEQLQGIISEGLTNPQGIPEETQALMTQQVTDTLKAKQAEDIRVMRNNMERRGITNSGFIFANEQTIRSNTTLALAKSITDIKIQSEFMKMANFEKSIGQAAQFLGYLGEMSALKYQPKYQTWAAQQQANLYQYQAQMDIYKTQLQQAYAQQNMLLAGQIAADAASQQHIWDVEMAEMELEAANKQAMYSGIGGLFGTTVGAMMA